MEVEIMKNTDAFHTVALLLKLFAQFTMLMQLVSDNGPQFTFKLFADFLNSNDTKHIRSSAYHPSSNGGAERFVQTVKKGLKVAGKQNRNAKEKLQDYLIGYCSTPATTTRLTPSELFLGRRIRTRLDLCKPKVKENKEDIHPLQEQSEMAVSGQKG